MICCDLIQVLIEMCPGLVLEKHVLSSEQLAAHGSTVYAWPPADMYTALLNKGVGAALLNPLTEREEAFTQLVCFGSQDVSFQVCLFYIAKCAS